MYRVMASLVLIFFITGYPINLISAKNTSESKILINVKPEKEIFNITNMKPGDSSFREITISNMGNEDFNYFINSRLKGGSRLLYNELIFTILSKDVEVFKGRMKELNEISPRVLKTLEEERLRFVVELPYEAGNYLQGKFCEVELKFYVEGTLNGTIPPGVLPRTSTNIFNNLFNGILLIGFGLIFYFIHTKKSDNK